MPTLPPHSLMDMMDADVGSGCGEKNCGLASGFPEDCSNQECHWEEPMFGLIELVCVTVIYIPLMLFGLLGNILTILVVWLRPHMRTSTYLYLSSMAVSDLLILLLLPLDLYKLWRPRPWPLGDLACKLTMFLSECCTFCTILHITFLSLERYLAVCWPITAKTLVTRRRTRTIIGCLWLGAAVSAAPVLVMVGVEDVGGEELGLVQWKEDGGWTGRETDQGGFMIGAGEKESGHMMMQDAGLEGTKWDGKETQGWGERVGELKWIGEKAEGKIGEVDNRQREDKSEMKHEHTVEIGREGEGKMGFEGEQQNKKEDEGGGKEGSPDEARGLGTDKKECRCTHFAISSGLLSAMMILSNLYFLVPLCILGLVYSLIGRTLWLRPKSSRRDQSHRNTVKMLGVIVLAFVLCWLPFHVGRTIFSLSLGAGTERQEIYLDTNSHSDTITHPDVSMESRDVSIHAITKPPSHSDSDVNFENSEILSKAGKMPAHPLTETDERFCDIGAKTEVKITTHTYDMGTDKHLHSHAVSHTKGKHEKTDKSTHNAQIQNQNVSVHAVKMQLEFNDNRNTHHQLQSSTDTITHSMQTKTPTAIKSQYDTPKKPPPIPTTEYSAASVEVYNDDTYNDTHFSNTYSPPETHLYFLYYLSQYFNLVSSVLFYLSAAVNPLLYNLMSARYRHAVHSLIHTQSHTQARRLHTLTVHHSTTTL